MPTEAEAEHAAEQVEEFTVPDGWHTNKMADVPEPAVDETEQWMVGEIYADETDETVSMWLLSAGVVQPYYDGYDNPREGQWGGVYDIQDLDSFPVGDEA